MQGNLQIKSDSKKSSENKTKKRKSFYSTDSLQLPLSRTN